MKIENKIKLITLPIVLFIIILGAIFFDQDQIKKFIENSEYLAPLAFIIVYTLITVLFLPGSAFSILGGLLFGYLWGTLYIVIGATIGASIAFMIGRYYGQEFTSKLLKTKFKKLQKYNQKLENNGFKTSLFLRLVPLFPFNGLNYALGLTKVKFKDYFFATFIGIIPGAFVIANIGANATDLRSPTFYLFIGLFILMMFIPNIYKKIKNHEKL
ncbi:TVP38/TMEM64 family protein [Candidatus Peregrinibacteria bacterium]|nr:TVP38/TMEM64 family protein [Candidatus Peregrinibacteria bacterium]